MRKWHGVALGALIVLTALASWTFAGWRTATAATATVYVGDTGLDKDWYGPTADSSSSVFSGRVYRTTVTAGDTITWIWPATNTRQNTVTQAVIEPDGTTWVPAPGGFDSGIRQSSDPPYTPPPHTFDTPGVYNYFCTLHNVAMRGRVTVVAPPTETPTTSPTPTDTPAPGTPTAVPTNTKTVTQPSHPLRQRRPRR